MKKLMIAALALCAAYGAQAMSVKWKATGSSAMQNYNAYLIVGSTIATDWANEAAVAAASVDGAHALATKSGANYATTVTSKDDSITKSGNFYLVLVKKDGSQFAVSSLYDESAYVYNTDATPPESSPATASWTANSATFNNFKGGGVPEPTSAMLVLLGVAGLALKRKRA